MYEIKITKRALKDIYLLTEKEKKKCKDIFLHVLAKNPYSGKKLKGRFIPNYSYRLNIKDRIIYEIDEKNKCIYIKRAKTHYGE